MDYSSPHWNVKYLYKMEVVSLIFPFLPKNDYKALAVAGLPGGTLFSWAPRIRGHLSANYEALMELIDREEWKMRARWCYEVWSALRSSQVAEHIDLIVSLSSPLPVHWSRASRSGPA